MPGLDVVTINRGIFADNYMLLLEPVSQLGIFPLPLGNGYNSPPPSNEDIARVAVGALLDSARHVGKSYQPTSPYLLSPDEIVSTFTKALVRPMRYLPNIPDWMLLKALSSFGLDAFNQVQVLVAAGAQPIRRRVLRLAGNARPNR